LTPNPVAGIHHSRRDGVATEDDVTDLDLIANLNVEIHRAYKIGDAATGERLQAERAAAYRRWLATR